MKAHCPRCGGKGWYMYDENHGKPCEGCCQHAKGWFNLTIHHAGYIKGGDNGCCKAGCGSLRRERCKMKPLSKAQQDLFIAMKRGMIVDYTKGKDEHAFRWDTMKRCTRELAALEKRGYVESIVINGNIRYRIKEDADHRLRGWVGNAPLIVHNVKCEECCDMMRTAEIRKSGKVICERCLHPRTPSCGNAASEHWDDDPSGASGSWDAVVRGYEGE